MSELLPAWLHVESDPPRRFALPMSAAESAMLGDLQYPIHPLLVAIGPIRQSASVGSIENPSVTVTLSNADGEASAILSTPPLGRRAHVYAIRRDVASGALASVREFSGVVTAVDLGDVATIQVQA